MCNSEEGEEGAALVVPRPIDEIEGRLLPFLALAYREWTLEVGERASKFKVLVFENCGGFRIVFLAKREIDERGLMGGRCRNGQDVEFNITADLKIESKSYFK